MFVNVPAGLLVLALAVALIAESRDPGEARARRLDVAGALIGTAALLALIYGISEAEAAGWISAQTLASLALALALGAAFLAVEGRSAAPLAALWVLGKRSVWAANLPGVVTFAGAVGVIFAHSLHAGGPGLRPIAGRPGLRIHGPHVHLAGRVAPPFLGRLRRPLHAGGRASDPGRRHGFARLALRQPESLAVLLAGTGVTGFGHITSIVAFRALATSGLPDHEQGLAAALATVAQQVDAALGVAIFAAVTAARSDAPAKPGTRRGGADRRRPLRRGARRRPARLRRPLRRLRPARDGYHRARRPIRSYDVMLRLRLPARSATRTRVSRGTRSAAATTVLSHQISCTGGAPDRRLPGQRLGSPARAGIRSRRLGPTDRRRRARRPPHWP